MKTRFDGELWVTALGIALKAKEMETDHLLNTIKMLVQKPARVQAMLVIDIERATFSGDEVWTASREDTRKQSVYNVTSLSGKELTDYVVNTPLFKALMAELTLRGVNSENILALYTEDAAFGL